MQLAESSLSFRAHVHIFEMPGAIRKKASTPSTAVTAAALASDDTKKSLSERTKKDAPKAHREVAKIVPSYSLTKSKKGVLHLWIQLPRSVPQSCLNMDATATHFHLDTKGWGANYEVDVPFPADTSVVLREGEEAEAEFQGGVLKVRFQTTESEKDGSSPASKGKRDRAEEPTAPGRSAKRPKKEGAKPPKGDRLARPTECAPTSHAHARTPPSGR